MTAVGLLAVGAGLLLISSAITGTDPFERVRQLIAGDASGQEPGGTASRPPVSPEQRPGGGGGGGGHGGW